jgi:D-3-phosphoglycerate dehydrogenase
MIVVLIDQVHRSFKDSFIEWGWEVIEGDQWTIEKLNNEIDQIEGIIIRSRVKLDKKILSKAKKLKFIGRPGSGLENIDVEYCKLNNIQVFRSPEGNRDALGEHIIGMLLMLLNNLKRADLQVRKGVWERESNRGREIKGKTIGIIGYGYMGSSFAEKLAGFGANVIAYDKYKTNFSSSLVKEVDLVEVVD